MKKEFGQMKFDVVIGNPPYNKGMDLDFVDLGYKISNKYTVMITPAKWQTAADDYSGCASKNIDYKGFREKLVPHMSNVVFYPDALDIFKISQVDGLTYFILDKQVHDKCEVSIKGSVTKELLEKLLIEEPTDKSIYNKMTKYFTIHVENDLCNIWSEHYGTEMVIDVISDADIEFLEKVMSQYSESFSIRIS